MRFLLLLIVFFTTACSSNKVSKNHGFISLENKFENMVINKSNKNDIIEVTDMSIDKNIANFFRKIFNLDKNIKFYANYYKKYNEYLSNNTLNNFTKDIINHNF